MSLSFVFPGQGSQSIGMLADLAAAYPPVEQTFAEASSVLGYDLWKVVQKGPESELNNTAVTQPAMLSAGVAVWRIWQAQGGAVPAVMAGHSLGEYTALVFAGAIAFTDAVALVAERGRLMQEAVPAGEGAMAAILGLEDAQVIAVCNEAAQGEVVSAVNFNSPGQVVVAGKSSAVNRAVELAKTAGAKRALLLPVSVPSHCLDRGHGGGDEDVLVGDVAGEGLGLEGEELAVGGLHQGASQSWPPSQGAGSPATTRPPFRVRLTRLLTARSTGRRKPQEVWQQRIGAAANTASPLFVDCALHFFAEEGTSVVLAPGRAYRELGRAALGEGGVMGTPAIAGRAIFLGTE